MEEKGGHIEGGQSFLAFLFAASGSGKGKAFTLGKWRRKSDGQKSDRAV